jgi:multicomponent Na+:H+ antiporter subunit E
MTSNLRYYLVIALVMLTGFLTGGKGSPFLVVAIFVLLAGMFLSTLKPKGQPIARFAYNVLRFLVDFVWDLAVSNFRLAHDVLTPTDYHQVELVEVPVSDLTPTEISFLAQRITLTPGTLSCGLSEDQKSIIVHMMYPIKGRDMGKVLRRPLEILKGMA